MQTKEVRDQRVDHASKVGGIGEDRGGIPVVAGLTFAMLAIVLFALGYLFFNAPSAQYNSNQVEPFLPQTGPRVTPAPEQQGRTLDQNPMSRTGSVSVPE